MRGAAIAAGLVLLSSAALLAAERGGGEVPIPPSRPGAGAEPAPAPAPEVQPAQSPPPSAQEKPAPEAPQPEEPKEEAEGVEKIVVSPELACRERLQNLGVVFKPMERIAAGACGIDAPVAVSGLAGEVEVRPAVTVSCEAAEMMARWTYEVVVPAARETLGGAVTLLSTADSYSCRNRNQAVSGRMSEHALGHAVDIAAVTVGGRSLAIAAPKGAASEETAFRVAIRRGACSYFTTVLGPGSDAAHANHMHLDVITRPSGYRLCQ